MSKCENLTGMTFGQLTVIERAENTKAGKARWLCRCICGNECIVRAKDLKRGQQTCGCGQGNVKHGMSRTKIYRTWEGMLQRCENPNCEGFDNYGGRGIKVCERWHAFENFYADVSVLPHFGEKGYSLDRIDVNGDYCPENVRWATKKQQVENRRNTIKIEYEGAEMTLAEAAEKSGINYSCLLTRYKRGDRGKRLFRPDNERLIIVEYEGVEMCLKDASAKSGINYPTLFSRYRAGDRGKKLFRPIEHGAH